MFHLKGSQYKSSLLGTKDTEAGAFTNYFTHLNSGSG